MLHLAQVKKNPDSGEMELLLLARQTSQDLWDIISHQVIPCNIPMCFRDRVLVLVKLGNDHEIIEVKEAKDWVMGLVETYLTNGTITPQWVQKEQEKVEQWRQEITAKSLDLTRRQLELETQKEQLQELEGKLKNCEE
ncbi:hypothetical protein [Crocosphaera chwakensis]|uniref:Uncharacterized protein n=1 Tax=Crocosphaera chwakensis CCY0110 TaxID=391612 RepID=A3IL88_9CHRO|nr:hypothetical protein [Crocosphaera chwakensis]EAZ92957.1 hypothetical protein CY0110_22712 [Crocosphaera chwakensis CCY0110]